jgi:hypothetical protein
MLYVLFSPAQPHIALESAGSLESIAVALAARGESDLTVCINEDGLSRGLSEAEQRELEGRLYALRAT